jgi:hypothetical protein
VRCSVQDARSNPPESIQGKKLDALDRQARRSVAGRLTPRALST